MNIDMSNVELIRKEDKWIYLYVDGVNDIKLIYDDGTYSNIKDLQKRIRFMENWNALNNENNGIAFYEFYTDEMWSAAKDAFSKTKNKEYLQKLLENTPAIAASMTESYIFEYATAAYDSYSSFIDLMRVESGKELGYYIQKTFAFNNAVNTITYKSICNSLMQKYQLSAEIDLGRAFINGLNYVDENNNSQTVTAKTLYDELAKEITLSKLCGDLASIALTEAVKSLGKSVAQWLSGKGVKASLSALLGVLEGYGGRSITQALNTFLSDNWEKIKRKEDIDWGEFNAVLTKASNSYVGDFAQLLGTNENFIKWYYNGLEFYTEIDVNSPGLLDPDSSTILKDVKRIISKFDNLAVLLKELEEKNTLSEQNYTGFFSDIKGYIDTNRSFINAEKSYFTYDGFENKMEIGISSTDRAKFKEILGDIFNSLPKMTLSCLETNDLDVYLNKDYFGDTSNIIKLKISKDLSQWFSLKGIDLSLSGFTAEEILDYNNIDYIKSTVGGTHFFIREDMYNSEVLKMQLPTDGRTSTTDKFIIGDNNVAKYFHFGNKNEEGETIYGGAGNDTIYGGLGNDNIGGGAGDDIIYGGEYTKEMVLKNESLINSFDELEEINDQKDNIINYLTVAEKDEDKDISTDYIYGNEGNDYLVGGLGEDYIYGGDDDDIIYGGTEFEKDEKDEDDSGDHLSGGKGNDIIYGGGGEDKIYGDEGNDYLVGGLEQDYIYGGEGDDIIFGGSELNDDKKDKDNSEDHLSGGAGNDGIYGGRGDDLIYGDEGNDYLVGGEGDDYIYGGDGNDILIAGKSKDEMSRFEANYLYGGAGDDILIAEAGVISKGQYLEGGNGYDRYITQSAIIEDSDGKGYIEGVSGTYKKVKGTDNLYQHTEHSLLFLYNEDKYRIIGRSNGKNCNLTTSKGLDIVLPGGGGGDDPPPPIAIPPGPIKDPWTTSKTVRVWDPLVINFDKNDVAFSKVSEGVYFDLDVSGTAERISWIKSNAGFLVLDRNEDGIINNGTELFGDANILKDGSKSTEGFQTLADFDDNQDKIINKDDEIFSKLKIWKDDNFNGFSENSEIKSLEELGIKEISLDIRDINKTSEIGNITAKEAVITMEDGSQNNIIEYFLNRDTMDTTHPLEANEEAYNNLIKDTKDLNKYVNIKGSGNLVNLSLALTQNSKLKSLLDEYYETNGKAENLVEEIIKSWAQKTSHLEILESYIGEKFNGVNGTTPNRAAVSIIEQTYQILKYYVSSLLYAHKVAGVEIAMLSSESCEDYFRIILDNNFYEGVLKLKALRNIKSILGEEQSTKFDLIMSKLQIDYIELKDLDKFIIDNEQSNLSTNDNIIYGSAMNNVFENNVGNDQYAYYDNFYDIKDTLGNNSIKITNFEIFKENLDFIYTKDGLSVIHLNLVENKEIIRIKELENITNIEFSDGTILTYSEILEILMKKISATNEDNNIGYTFSKLIIDTLAGNDKVYSGKYDDIINGGGGNDEVYSGAGNDIIVGGLDNDYLEGGAGNDSYIFNKGDGQDTIVDNQGNDVIKFGENIGIEDIIFSTNGEGHITLKIKETDNFITIKKFNKNFSLEFLSGIVVNFSEILNNIKKSLQMNEGNNEIIYNISEIEINAFAGNDTIKTGNYNDTIYGGLGNDIIYSSGGNDLIVGGLGNDYLDGGTGIDTYIFNKGDGQDVIYDLNDGNIIKFGEDIKIEDLFIYTNENGFIKIEVGGKENSILLKDFSKINKLIFSDNSEISYGDLIEKSFNNIKNITSTNDDDINYQFKGYEVHGLEGNDKLLGSNYDDKLYGDSGDDLIFGSYGNDYLEGGQGNDYLEGGLGSDIYIYNLGDGHDTYSENGWEKNKIILGNGIKLEDLKVEVIGDDVLIIFNEDDSIRLKSFYSCRNLFELKLSDDTTLGFDAIIKIAGKTVTVSNDDDNITYFLDASLEINTLAGDDVVKSGNYNDTIKGGEGNDKIYSGYGDDVLEGGKDNDYLEGGAGNDTYIFNMGDGFDSIYDYQGVDTIKFGENISKENIVITTKSDGLEISIKNSDNSVITDKIFIKNMDTDYGRIEKFEFFNGEILNYLDFIKLAGSIDNNEFSWFSSELNIDLNAGDDIVKSGNYNDTTKGGEGNDKIYSGYGDDVLEGGKDNDYLEGGAGNDTYIFNMGDGFDSIYDYQGVDTIKFGENISKENIVITTKSDGLEIGIKGDNNSAITDKIFMKNMDTDYGRIEKFEFFNGEILNYLDFIKLAGSINNDEFSWFSTELNIDLNVGDDIVKSGNYNDTIKGGEGNDKIYSGYGDDVLEGGKDNDYLEGGAGNDTYIFNKGDGFDSIYDYQGVDTIKFGENISKENIVITTKSDGLEIGIKGDNNSAITDKIFIKNMDTNYGKIEKFEFFNGEILNYLDFIKLAGSINNDEFSWFSTELNIDLNVGDDIVKSGNYNDVIKGGEGNDKIYSGYGDDILEGGKGSDYLDGGYDSDTYKYSLGDGFDVISDSIGNDVIQFGENISYSDLNVLTDNEGNLLLEIKNTKETIKLLSENVNIKLRFVGGSEIDYSTLLKDLGTSESNNIFWNKSKISVKSLDGNDEIYTGKYDDTLEGGLGDDILSGGLGNNTYLFNLGDGKDTIKLATNTDIIKFGEGITKDNITLTREETNLIIYTPNLLDKLVVENWYSSYKLNKIIFIDGSEMTMNDIHTKGLVVKGISENDELFGLNNENDVLYGLSGNDNIQGLSGNDKLYGDEGNDELHGGLGDDILYGGLGDDTLYGEGGVNTYILNLGDGKDTIKLATNTDIIKFGEGITKDNITLTREGTNLIIYTSNSEDKITIENWYSSYRLSKIIFIDGSEMLRDEIHTKGLVLKGTIENDELLGLEYDKNVLYGLGGNDVIKGGHNNDILYGNEGNDIIYGGNGDDYIEGGLGDDTIHAGYGKNLIKYSLGDGNDIILNNNGEETLLLSNIKVSDIKDIVRIGENAKDVVITFNNNETITLTSQNISNIESFEFADKTLTAAELIRTVINITGTSQDDNIVGYETNEILHGQDGNDIINAMDGNDIIFGDGGQDKLYGNNGNDILNGGIGDDNLYGGLGNDTYVFAKDYGNDTISETDYLGNSDKVILSGLNQSDINFSRNINNLLVTVNSTGETLTILNYFNGVNSKIELFEFADGTMLNKESINDLFGYDKSGYRVTINEDNFDVYFHRSNVYIKMNIFNSENGGIENTFSYSGSQVDFDNFINSGMSVELNNQVNNFITQILHSNIKLESLKNDIMIYENELREILTQCFEFKKESISESITQEIDLDNTTALNITGTVESDILSGNRLNDILDGKAGNDFLDGGSGSDTYIFGRGYGQDSILDIDLNRKDIDQIKFKDAIATDINVARVANNLELSIKGTSDKVTVVNFFSGLNNQIESIEFSDESLWDKDMIYQNLGFNLSGYRMSVSDSFFTIEFKRMDVFVSAKISSTSNGLSSEFSFSGDSDKFNNFKVVGEDINISNQINQLIKNLQELGLDYSSMIDSIKNNESEIREILTQSLEFKKDSLVESITQEIIYEGNAELPEDKILYGTIKNDSLAGDRGNDTLDGGFGDDILDGSTGNDTYVFGKGYGIDTILDKDSTLGNIDKILFKDILSSEITVTQNGNNLEITISDTSDKLIVVNYFKGIENEIETFEFSDGTLWTKVDLFKVPETTQDNSANNLEELLKNSMTGYRMTVSDSEFSIIFKRMGVSVTLNISTANNSISANYGFSGTSAQYAALQEAGEDVNIGNQIGALMNNMINSGLNLSNLKSSIKENEEQFKGILIQSFEFKQESELYSLTQEISYEGDTSIPDTINIIGTVSFDILVGNRGNDILDGKEGDDILDGGSGNDTYIFGKGYGIDTILDKDSTSGNIDKILFKDILPSEITSTQNGNNLEITISDTSDKLIVVNYFKGIENEIETFEFSDGTLWDKNDLFRVPEIPTNTNTTNLEDLLKSSMTGYRMAVNDSAFSIKFKRVGVSVTVNISIADYSLNASYGFSGTSAQYAALQEAGEDVNIGNQIGALMNNMINSGLDLSNLKSSIKNNEEQFKGILIQSFEFKQESELYSLTQEISYEGDTSIPDSINIIGTSSADILIGNRGNDTLDGKEGNDILDGGSGNDTYIFGRGYGVDTILDNSGSDILRIDVNPLDLIFEQNGSDLDISIYGTTDKMTVKSWFSGATNQIEKIVANETELLVNTATQNLIQAMASFGAANQMTWNQAIQNKENETNGVLYQYWTHQDTMVK